ncbi:class I SAM-dependent methyltransferase [Siccirubricoccus sp. G192]|uniref:class I SAM-dependent methyltransferase n=1 Tax=Siccirubricoccus sp. G192 TaxID=2849651 RepID=UPI001C2C5F8E|nr:class I SAM-dependent methyltransferase [Siccirubricoccus sp. G192]MBV1798054.1 class I SAM-dependent methyltransferase [Siccirubricoccus sp. G192]
MSSQFRYLLTYEQMVSGLLNSLPEDEAAARAVGGDYERFGVLEHALLRGNGLAPDSCVVDAGCGSGRLATQLARYPGLRYIGTDVVPALLDYARRKVGRADFRFEPVDRIILPVPDGEADFVVFFSVFTHLLAEESYVYLAESLRALRPGGKVIFSFLEFAVAQTWPVFEGNVEWVRSRSMAGHLNVFLHRADLRLWARRLGFSVVGFHDGDARFITVDEEAATAAMPMGNYALGQSVCVLQKPLPGESTAEEAPPRQRGRAAMETQRARDRAERQAARAARRRKPAE